MSHNPIQYHYGKFPPANINYDRVLPLIGEAAAAVARYDGMLLSIPNPTVLLSPLTIQEAVLSSKIEGTQATMGEVLEFEASGEAPATPAREHDIYEVLNYRKAIAHAESLMSDLPLSQRVLFETHRLLLDGVRGQNKAPGEYRRVPNWIGPSGCTVDSARFVPISASSIPEAMGRWEKYLHEDGHDRILQLAIAHAEFEALHPFLDGNGRLGRMLVPLFLWEHKLIHRPMFYLSGYLEQRRDEYYDGLLAVSRDGDWTGWCVYFLRAITEQARENLKKAQSILGLYNGLKPKVIEWTHSQYAIPALDWIFGKPIFLAPNFIEESIIPRATASRILGVFRDKDMLKTIRIGKGSRGAIYAFRELLNIAEGRDAFK